MEDALRREEWDFSGLDAGELIPALLWEARRERLDVDEIDRTTQAWLAGKLSTKKPPMKRNKRTGTRPRYNSNFSEADTARIRATTGFDVFIPLAKFVWSQKMTGSQRRMEYGHWLANHIRPLHKNRKLPWRCLPIDERRRISEIYEQFRSAGVVRIGAWWDAVAQFRKDKPDRGVPLKFDFRGAHWDNTTVLFTIDWRYGRRRILEAMAKILKQLEPPDVKRFDWRGKKNRDVLVMLERLAIMRLLHYYTLAEIQVRLPEAWTLYRTRKWYDDRRQGLRDFRELVHHRDAEQFFPKSWETKAQRTKKAAQLPGK
jgi:hypothetical protein